MAPEESEEKVWAAEERREALESMSARFMPWERQTLAKARPMPLAEPVMRAVDDLRKTAAILRTRYS